MDEPLVFSNPPGVAPPIGRYSHLVVVPPGARLLVLAGQTGHGLDGSLPSDPGEQWVGAIRNIRGILASQGASMANVIKLNTWVVSGADISKARSAAVGLFEGAPPATTFAYVSALFLPEILVEVEAWAAVPVA